MSAKGIWAGETESTADVTQLDNAPRLWCDATGPPFPPGVKRSMFPATGQFARLNEQLRNCVRMMPHRYDGGGFFVARILRKTKAPRRKVPRIERPPSANLPTSHDQQRRITTGRAGGGCLLQTLSASEWNEISTFYGLAVTEHHSQPKLMLEGNRIVLVRPHLCVTKGY